MSVDRRLPIALLTMSALVAAACGTTVPPEVQEAAEVAAATGEDLGGVLPEGATINEEGEVVSASGEVLGDAEDFGIDNSSDSGSTTTSSTDTGDTDTETADPGKNGPGITASTIKIGVSYSDDTEEANAAIGADEGASQINTKRAWQAMVEYMNNHGGVAGGRKLEIVWNKFSSTSTEPYDQQDQAACRRWSEDDPVFIVDGNFKTENGIACFQKNGMVTIAANGLGYMSAAFFERYPTYMEFDGVDNDAIARMYADNMKKMGFFDKGYKLGIITWADPEYANPTKNVLVPRLRQLGIKIADVTYIQTNQSGGEAATPISQLGNTALRYKNDNITHVMAMDSHGSIAFFFGQAAERQQYRPRYGLHSGSGGTAIANTFSGTSGEQDARNQFEDAVMIGWWPTIDVNFEDIPAWGKSSQKKVCHKIMRDAGIQMADSNAEGLAENVCNNVWAMQATLDAIPGNVINQQTWYQSLARVSQMDVLLTISPDPLRLSPSRRDPLENYARAKFYDGCVCFKYVSGPLPIPD